MDVMSSLADAIDLQGDDQKYCCHLRRRTQNFRLFVSGVGNVSLPLSAQDCRKLVAQAKPAHLGYRDQTLYDPSVRSGLDISADQIKMDDTQFTPILNVLKSVKRFFILMSGLTN